MTCSRNVQTNKSPGSRPCSAGRTIKKMESAYWGSDCSKHLHPTRSQQKSERVVGENTVIRQAQTFRSIRATAPKPPSRPVTLSNHQYPRLGCRWTAPWPGRVSATTHGNKSGGPRLRLGLTRNTGKVSSFIESIQSPPLPIASALFCANRTLRDRPLLSHGHPPKKKRQLKRAHPPSGRQPRLGITNQRFARELTLVSSLVGRSSGRTLMTLHTRTNSGQNTIA